MKVKQETFGCFNNYNTVSNEAKKKKVIEQKSTNKTKLIFESHEHFHASNFILLHFCDSILL